MRMSSFDCISGNKSVAYAAKLARVEVIPAYPITPQTTIIEYLADFVSNGELKAEYIHSDGEHSAMGMAVGASLAGARVFTSTSSQGLAYMHEVVAQAPSLRTPLVMAVVNRVLGWYWSIGPDYSDVAPELNLGWLCSFAESNQECLDTVLQLYKIAEDRRVLLPAMVNLDGFYLSYSYERVLIPKQDEVDAWLPKYTAPYPVDPSINKIWPSHFMPWALHTKYRRLQEEILEGSQNIIEEVDEDYRQTFGRSYGGLVDEYKCEDSDCLLITLGTMSTAARRAVDKLRNEGVKIGLARLRFLRPFPKQQIRKLALQSNAIGIVDRMVLAGTNTGMAATDVKNALFNFDKRLPVLSFITGMGGEDVTTEDFIKIGRKISEAAKTQSYTSETEFIEHPFKENVEFEASQTPSMLYPTSDACSGCGSSIIARKMLDVFGENTIVINTPSCSAINYPGVSKVPWILTNFAAGAAYGTGVIRALKIKGRSDKVRVAAYSGDGGTVDIGLQSLSGAAERGEPLVWVCYDNEAYMNTGIQRSGSTPFRAVTTTTPAITLGKSTNKKNMVMIMAAHRIPYIATASIAYLQDMENKFMKAVEITDAGKGLAYIHVQQPCTTGWYYPPEKTVEVARLAVQTGAWPLLEVDEGVLKINVKPKELKPLNEYLKIQGRFKHLNPAQIETLQKDVQDEWMGLLELEKTGRFPGY
jgi:pyruvate ferredoxin oxidoreductase alpha subunit